MIEVREVTKRYGSTVAVDGLSFDGSTVLEIKCPVNVRDQSAAQQGRVPPQYYAQLQHELEVSGAAEAHYWSFDGSAGSLVRVQPDREYLKRLLDAEAAFWQLVRENVWPEPAGGELDLSVDPKWRPRGAALSRSEGAAGDGNRGGA